MQCAQCGQGMETIMPDPTDASETGKQPYFSCSCGNMPSLAEQRRQEHEAYERSLSPYSRY